MPQDGLEGAAGEAAGNGASATKAGAAEGEVSLKVEKEDESEEGSEEEYTGSPPWYKDKKLLLVLAGCVPLVARPTALRMRVASQLTERTWGYVISSSL